MKHSSKRMLLLLLATAVVVLSGCTLTIISNEDWTLYYQWDDSSQGIAVWTLSPDGTFIDNVHGSGYWTSTGSYFQLRYNNTFISYSGTDYEGTIASTRTSMSGTMSGENPDHIVHTGTWYAQKGWKTVKNLAPGALPSRAPSGEPLNPRKEIYR